ncbi:Fe-S cluster assembly sulfur transfer protein SufU [Meiothermus ruber]|jgi:nitrogen fixation NifU-like protein|uniref:SUF system FeS assembly protein n=1 Tax=Meiothermus ruber (strain ATCC 35948 / DSM 1279 / VKM B-1258 / 21) TaxID=504728 RepID=D3PLH3_MEIRD|nr:SUF system NifU family Fe-S cluster assembly protein [Meiothermus ruber]ADD29064.1 SUF system FeS assembly protein, NifU family [Meiothermus ruber DSM 1279]AGK05485.1 SUF system FeS assembly protein [Meiothermus ruber DSM 1279]MCL6528603.1 SUF system NifU family Fe-S cluster assembly protein [Meiothermus ruber]GAO75985.1 SUF system FeS assembly protein [Meiothermus ruber H328]
MSLLEELYKEIILRHYKSPHNYGSLESANVRVVGDNPSCGDQIELLVETDGEQIADVRFRGQGCAISQASASLMTDLVKGKTWAEALELERKFKSMILDGTPPSPELGDLAALSGVHKLAARVKCATLAWNALEQAAQEARTKAQGA